MEAARLVRVGGGQRYSASCYHRSIGKGRAIEAGAEQPIEELHRKVAAGKPVAELGEIGLQVPSKNPVVHPPEDALDVDHQDVRQAELFGCRLGTLQHQPFLLEVLGQGEVGAAAVGEDARSLGQGLPSRPFDILRGERDEKKEGK